MESDLIRIFSDWGLVATFTVLYLSGLGLPIPEEITLLTCGYVASMGAYDPFTASVVAVFGILAGDSSIFYIGRRFGRRAVTHGPFRRFIKEETINRAEAAFHRRRDLFVFGARFMAGVRLVGYFTAGMMRVKYLRFLFLDFLGAIISGPTSIYFAYYLGKTFTIEVIQTQMHHYRNWAVVGIVIAIVLGLLIRKFHRRVNAYLFGNGANGVVSPPATSSATEPISAAPTILALDKNLPDASGMKAPPVAAKDGEELEVELPDDGGPQGESEARVS